jgi:hypothetical protein
MIWAAYYLAVCACSVLRFPTGTLHFRDLVARVADGRIRVRAFSVTPSARNPPSGFRDPEGFQIKFKLYKRCSNNQAEQLAVIKALESIDTLNTEESSPRTATV